MNTGDKYVLKKKHGLVKEKLHYCQWADLSSSNKIIYLNPTLIGFKVLQKFFFCIFF